MSTARKKPQDRQKPAAEDVFEFEHNGETYALPRFGSWKSGMVRKIRKLPEVDGMYTILEHVCRDGSGFEESLAALDDMEMDEFNATMSAWQEHSGVTLGESSRSSA